MGTLDEAIREHLELRRRQGVAEDELRQAEAEAFGPGEEDLAPGASVTAPAGEGDQLDKVFSGEEAADAPPTTVMKPGAPAEPADTELAPESATAGVEETTVIEPSEPAASEPGVVVGESAVVEVEEVAEPEPATPAEPEAQAPEAPAEPEAPPAPAPEPLGDEADASDLLEAERANLTGHPTENYDVDAAIAEEEELDILSEGRLSEELDRALGQPGEGMPEGLGGASPGEPAPEGAEEVGVPEAVEEIEVVEETAEPVPEEEPDDSPDDRPESASPLEDTPDFLEDAPASDELWFEQGEPKDFDFGD